MASRQAIRSARSLAGVSRATIYIENKYVCFITQPTGMTLLLWLSLGSLFLHQVEELRFPGYFPGMANAVMFKSDMPDRYPLNANSGMLINVVFEWGGYLLAALLWKQAMWLVDRNTLYVFPRRFLSPKDR